MTDVRVLSLHQPWAEWVAAGAKSIETRSWPTSYRGRLLIHATLDYSALYRWGRRGWEVSDLGRMVAGLEMHRTELAAYAGRNGYRRRPVFTLYGRPLPLGAIVASCKLAGVAPIGGPFDFSTGIVEGEPCPTAGQDVIVNHGHLGGDDPLMLDRWDGGVHSISDQLPYGDFIPGRYGFLLEDVRRTSERCPMCWGGADVDAHGRLWRTVEDPPGFHRRVGRYCTACGSRRGCDPVSMRGRQRLWVPRRDG